jgi:hypothetical protein
VISTFSEYKELESSEKISLVVLESVRRLMGWVLHSGSVYKLDQFTSPKVVSVEENGTALVAGSSASLSAGQYYYDESASVFYIRVAGSGNPNARFISLTEKNFYSNNGVSAPFDLSTGNEVYWLPILSDTSDFTLELDNQNQLGVALEGAGSVKFFNDQEYWKSRFDKLTWENQKVFVYAWNRQLPITEAKLLFKGRIVGKSWSPQSVSFSCKDLINELRAPIELEDMADYVGARITDSEAKRKQRLVYGYNFGYRPLNIDQFLEGYPIPGTVTVTNASATVTGSSTEFLKYLSIGDRVTFTGIDDDFTIAAIASNTSLTLTDEFPELTQSGLTLSFQSENSSRWVNREWLIAGHSTREPNTTIDEGFTLDQFSVVDGTDILPGDQIIIGTEQFTVEQINENLIRTTTNLVSLPLNGTAVRRPSVSNVFINDNKLIFSRDYDYNPATAVLTLDPLAEFNISKEFNPTGTITLTNTSRSVTGSGTLFLSEFKVNDWVRVSPQADFFEILSIETDTAMTLRTPSTYTQSGTGLGRRVAIFNTELEDVLSCDIMGKSSTAGTGGVLLKTGAQIVEDLLIGVGLGAELDSASFDTSSDLNPAPLGVLIPKSASDTKSPKVRDVISEINKSVFGSLIQNNSFLLEYNVLRPRRSTASLSLSERDVLSFSIKADSSKIIKTAKIRYKFKEYDPPSKEALFSEAVTTSNIGQYLTKTQNEFILDTFLSFQVDAETASQRWAFLLELASTTMSISTKLQAIDTEVNEAVVLSHEKVYERLGSSSSRKVGAVQRTSRSAFKTELELEDLAQAFSRCSVITEDTADDYLNSSDSQRAVQGYITDTYGMINNDSNTFGLHLIW